jgi:hypothetical protein
MIPSHTHTIEGHLQNLWLKALTQVVGQYNVERIRQTTAYPLDPHDQCLTVLEA